METTRISQDPIEAQGASTSSREADGVLAAVRRLPLEVFSEGNVSVLDEVLAPDYVDHSLQPGMPQGADGVRFIVNQLRTAMPDLKATLDIELRDGTFVVHHVHLSGTNTGAAFGVPATGRRAVWAATNIFRTRGNLIVEHWGVVKLDSLWIQLGLIELPGAARSPLPPSPVTA
jgi:predicted ester cyclase